MMTKEQWDCHYKWIHKGITCFLSERDIFNFKVTKVTIDGVDDYFCDVIKPNDKDNPYSVHKSNLYKKEKDAWNEVVSKVELDITVAKEKREIAEKNIEKLEGLHTKLTEVIKLLL